MWFMVFVLGLCILTILAPSCISPGHIFSKSKSTYQFYMQQSALEAFFMAPALVGGGGLQEVDTWWRWMINITIKWPEKGNTSRVCRVYTYLMRSLNICLKASDSVRVIRMREEQICYCSYLCQWHSLVKLRDKQ